MSNLEKVANFTPAELMGTTAMGGAGAFATVQLLKELLARAKPPQGIPQNSQLMVDIPTKKKEEEEQQQQQLALLAAGHEPMGMSSVKTAGGFNEPIDNLSSAIVGMSGLPAGFFGTKLLYDAYKNHELNAKLEAQKKQYNDMLYQAKFGEATPELDNFCESLADELNKQGDFRQHIGTVMNNQGTTGPLRAGANAVTGGVPDLIGDAWLTLAGGVGLGGLAGLIAQSRKKQEKEERGLYPNRVTLNQPAM